MCVCVCVCVQTEAFNPKGAAMEFVNFVSQTVSERDVVGCLEGSRQANLDLIYRHSKFNNF